MHPDNPELPPFECAIGFNRTAWFQHRQVERMGIVNLDTAPHEDGVTVPADTAGPNVERHVMPRRLRLD